MTHPACSVYVQTTEGRRFGPYTVDVELTIEWAIVGRFVWQNTAPEELHVDKIVMLSPIGVKAFDGENTEVEPTQEAHLDFTIINNLQTTWNDAVGEYLSGRIDVNELEYRLEEPEES